MEHNVVRLEKFDCTFGYAAHPDGGTASDPLARRVNVTVGALAALDRSLASGQDARSTHAALQIEIAKTKAATREAAAALAKEEQRLYAVPATTDPVQDAELRAFVSGLSPERRTTLFAEMGKGKHNALLHALARFAAPTPEAELARTLYRDAVESANPAAARDLALRRAAVEWAEGTTSEVVRVVDAATTAAKLPASVLITT